MAQEIVEMLRALPFRMAKAPRLDRPEMAALNLYFIQTDCAEGHIKIGIGADVISRMAQMQTGCPYKLKLLKVVKDAAHMEKVLHREFADDNLHGEWFRMTDRLLKVIDALEGFDPNPPRPSIDPISFIFPEMECTS